MFRGIFHGHSVPSGYHKTPEMKPFESYPHPLYQELKSRYPRAVINVIVTAIGDENSITGEQRFGRDEVSLNDWSDLRDLVHGMLCISVMLASQVGIQCLGN